MTSSRDSQPRSVSQTPRRALPVPAPAAPQSQRRRNHDAARAVLTAAVEMLDDPRIGYRNFTMKAVAARAGVSKATLYRWWPDKAHLVLDAYRSKGSRDIYAPTTGDLRTDVLAHLGHLAFTLTRLDSARTVAGIIVAAATDPYFGRLYRETLLNDLRQALLDILIAARERGQIRAGIDLAVAVDAAYGAIQHRLLLSKEPIDGPFVTALTDLLIAGLTT
jgi:AcrR family transcriptional regulator